MEFFDESAYKRHKSTGQVCRLTVREWQQFIWPHLELDDLVFLRRTCSTFAKSKELREMVTKKTENAFGHWPKKHWNKIMTAPYKKRPPYSWIFNKLCIELSNGPYFEWGLFSTKRRMVTTFRRVMSSLKKIDDCSCQGENSFRITAGSHTLLITGFTRQEMNFICRLSAYQPGFTLL